MKTTIKQTTEVEVEIQLPYYFKNICHAYVICTEQTAICVSYGLENHESIHNYSSMIELVLATSTKEDAIEITKDEFKKIYGQVALILNGIV